MLMARHSVTKLSWPLIACWAALSLSPTISQYFIGGMMPDPAIPVQRSFSDEFPDIADIRIRVSSTKSPIHERPPYREFGFEAPKDIECANPLCKNGKLQLWPLIRTARAKRETSI